jgi:hypothetical protein
MYERPDHLDDVGGRPPSNAARRVRPSLLTTWTLSSRAGTPKGVVRLIGAAGSLLRPFPPSARDHRPVCAGPRSLEATAADA